MTIIAVGKLLIPKIEMQNIHLHQMKNIQETSENSQSSGFIPKRVLDHLFYNS